jgi:AcrR family transcriptional regulator
VITVRETPSPRRPRRTQAERTAETRSKLLDATIECLIEQGYGGTTTLAVCKRAGVSHGSLQHHFGKRDGLLGAALECVYARLRDRVVARLELLPEGEPRVEAMVDIMWEGLGAREFKAVLELWLAAANQPELSWAVWPEARAFDAGNIPLAKQLFPEFAARVPDFDVYVSLLFQALQGMGLVQVTMPELPENMEMRRRVRALLTRIMSQAFESSTSELRGEAP